MSKNLLNDPPLVIAVLNSKGGSGKTTISTNLAHGLQLDGRRVLLGDVDPKGTAAVWGDMQPDSSDLPPVVGLTKRTLDGHLGDVAAAYDVVVIDGAAKLQSITIAALKAADIVLIPVRPSAADLWAVDELVEMIQQRRELTGGSPRAAFVVSQQIVGTNLAGEMAEALEHFGMPLLEGRTAQRIAYAEALSSGTTVLGMKPSGKAAGEIRALTQDVLTLAQCDTDSAHE